MQVRIWRGGGIVLSMVLLAGMLSACALGPKPAPPYQGDRSKEPTNLTPFEQGPIRMGLPPGYGTQELPPNADAELTQVLKKDGSSARIQIRCYGAFVNKTGIHAQLLQITAAVMPNAVRATGPFSLAGPPFGSEFDGWTGTITASGQEVPMNIYLAWRLDSRIGGCKYGLFAVVSKQESDAFLPEFIAMARSLQ